MNIAIVMTIAFSSRVVGTGPTCQRIVYAGASMHVQTELAKAIG